MVAVSLLFSIYQVKPSPFCVLDELDAPPVLRSNGEVNWTNRTSTGSSACCPATAGAHSQFIIITHNKPCFVAESG